MGRKCDVSGFCADGIHKTAKNGLNFGFLYAPGIGKKGRVGLSYDWHNLAHQNTEQFRRTQNPLTDTATAAKFSLQTSDFVWSSATSHLTGVSDDQQNGGYVLEGSLSGCQTRFNPIGRRWARGLVFCVLGW